MSLESQDWCNNLFKYSQHAINVDNKAGNLNDQEEIIRRHDFTT
jgi:hypothetical protein